MCRDDESPEELQGFAKTWDTKYSTANISRMSFPSRFTSFILIAMFTGMRPNSLASGAALMLPSYWQQSTIQVSTYQMETLANQ